MGQYPDLFWQSSRAGELKMPSGKYDKPVIIDNHDGTVTFKYDPKEVGTHELHIKHNLEHVQDSPFKFHVDNVGNGTLTAYGPGLVHGVAGEPCSVTVSNSKSNAIGKISVSVDGPSKAEVNCHDNKDGTMSVTYVPPSPGEYKVSIKAGDKHIRGSPFTTKITAEGRKRSQITFGHSSEVSLNVQEKEVKCLNASIVAPSGLEEPCFVKKRQDGSLGISFTPREEGEHLVNVKKLGNHLPGSPFKINVLVKDIGNASKVKITGNGLKEGKTHTENQFVLHTSDAGFGGINFSVEGRSAAELKCEDKGDGVIVCSYKPTEPGYYVINLKFADHHVPGSPFTVKVTGPGSNIIRETIKKKIEQVPPADIGQECKLVFRLPGTNAFDMAAKVTNPTGVTDDAMIIDMEDCQYGVFFTPKEPGIHTISVRCKDIHIPGSPFQFTVGGIQSFGAHKIHAGGLGLERGGANEPCEFNLYTREAGAGVLHISVEGPSRAEINIQEISAGTFCVTYKVSEPGDYRVGIKFNDEPIPDSPFKVFILPDVGEARKIELGHIPDAGLQVNKPIAFTIQMNGAKGLIDGKVISPSGGEDDCFVSPIDEDSWALRFIPKENGIHQIHLRHNGTHIPQSPFRIVIGHDDSDPAAVQASGNGLKECKSGVKTDFLINTCNAGTGQLAVTIEGPSKVSMDCTEVADGYKVRYTPLAPGDYFVTIKYNGYHIVGSPFKVHCTGTAVAEPGSHEVSSVMVETVAKQSKHKGDQLPKFRSDPSKITSKGPGLKKAITHKMNSFQVNCQEAGNNILFVSLYGPKGPCDEIHVKHAGRNIYNITYMVKDRGEHILIVKYGNDHIPGSPFKVDCT
ncbi:filamin-A-like isoform X2 [Stegodyphus dumicola]|uniref:filamin-A-like isoform X2 n=1 Tax=Stegodyphus dumicola TaxID=202533 RepID=UPI0015AF7F0B|nr:filamin-A-like isoform X2 [Stegodyphus dumicola]